MIFAAGVRLSEIYNRGADCGRHWYIGVNSSGISGNRNGHQGNRQRDNKGLFHEQRLLQGAVETVTLQWGFGVERLSVWDEAWQANELSG